jgi:hypothetical protein
MSAVAVAEDGMATTVQMWLTTGLSRMRYKLRQMLVAIAVGVWACTRCGWAWTYYAAGWWEAERELWRRDATIYTTGGLSVSVDICNIDEETGLPLHFVSGCVTYDGASRRWPVISRKDDR